MRYISEDDVEKFVEGDFTEELDELDQSILFTPMMDMSVMFLMDDYVVGNFSEWRVKCLEKLRE